MYIAHMLTSPPGSIVVSPDFLQVHDLVGPEKTKTLSTMSAVFDVGCFFSAILAFTVRDSLGRKKAILLGTTVMAEGTIIQAASFSLPQMLVGRIISG